MDVRVRTCDGIAADPIEMRTPTESWSGLEAEGDERMTFLRKSAHEYSPDSGFHAVFVWLAR